MKRKYYFVILFLMLTIFLIINTSSVNATMYKILDSERNIIRITSNPVLSIEEIEAGCIILSAPEGSIESIPNQMISGSKGYSFRKTNWGMNKEQVKATEKEKIILETENEIDFMAPDFSNGNFACTYMFLEDKLYQSGYVFIGKHIQKYHYVDDYNNLKETLARRYGKPKIDKKDLQFKFNEFNEVESSWYTATWETSTTIINLGLIFNKNKTVLAISYNSKELKEWAEQIKEKETSKGL